MNLFGMLPALILEEQEFGLSVRASGGNHLPFLPGRTHATSLQVTAEGVTATGDLGGHNPGMLRLPWDRIRELHFAPPGKGEVGGLYAREGEWCSRCILPRIAESQADEVIAAITQRFPRALSAAYEPVLRPSGSNPAAAGRKAPSVAALHPPSNRQKTASNPKSRPVSL